MSPIVIALIGAAAAFLIFVALAWRPGVRDEDEEPRGEGYWDRRIEDERPEHVEAAVGILSERYEAEEALAASEGDLPHASGAEDMLGPEDQAGAYAEEGPAKVIPDAGTIVGDLPETRAPRRQAWKGEPKPDEELVPHG